MILAANYDIFAFMTLTADISRDDILASLRGLEGTLRAKGVTGLAIFGSRAAEIIAR
ncbi:MAG: hypothetical protein WDN48_04730 [Pseudolabrys sp.]